MGIMYKLMKHRHLTSDLAKANSSVTKAQRDKCRLLTIEGNIIESNNSSAVQISEEDLPKDMETEMDKQFTAEHILQLCKFLAEKSKRNKNVHRQQQSPKKLNKSKQPEFHFQQMDYDDTEYIDYYQNEALPLLTPERLQQQKDEEQQCHQNNLPVLSTRLSPDINSFNISSATTTSCALQHHHHQQQQYQQQQQQTQHQHQNQNQGKRDILLKIRHQIFERKRLRERGGYEPQALNNSQVWRPW